LNHNKKKLNKFQFNMADYMQFKTRNREIVDIDISAAVLEPIGFEFNCRIMTPKGPAKVLGVGRDGKLWLVLEGEPDNAASFFGNVEPTVESLKKHNFVRIAEEPMRDTDEIFCDLKKIQFNGRSVQILQQNHNGPCPLIAMFNVLLLTGQCQIDKVGGHTPKRISLDNVASCIADHIASSTGQSTIQMNEKEDPIPIIDLLRQMEAGLDVNFSFLQLTEYQMTPHILLFTMAEVSLVHQWLLDPSQVELEKALKQHSSFYDEITNLIAAHNEKQLSEAKKVEENEKKEEKPAPAVESKKKSKKKKSDNEDDDNDDNDDNDITWTLNEEQVELIKDFYKSTSSAQMTDYGSKALRDFLQPDQPAVLFFRNHFFVVVNHAQQLYALVTDKGFNDSPQIVWENLSAMTSQRGSSFYDAEFRPFNNQEFNEMRSSGGVTSAQEIVSQLVEKQCNALVRSEIDVLSEIYADNAVFLSAPTTDMLHWRVRSTNAKKDILERLKTWQVAAASMQVRRVDTGGSASSNVDEPTSPRGAQGGVAVVDQIVHWEPKLGNAAHPFVERCRCVKTFARVGDRLQLISEIEQTLEE